MEYSRTRKGNRLLIIFYDNDTNPRRDFENVSMMKIVWNGYTVGDKPEESPDDYLKELCRKEFRNDSSYRKALSYLKRKDRLVYDSKRKIYCNRYVFMDRTYTEEIYNSDHGHILDQCIREVVIDLMENNEMMDILTRIGYEFQILSMYEHGGLALHKGVDRGWDSGTCGFCVVSRKQAEENGIRRNWRKWAHRIMDGEIEEYDDYLQGQCYGYELYEMPIDDYNERLKETEDEDEINIEYEGELIESISGYLGFDELKKIEKLID